MIADPALLVVDMQRYFCEPRFGYLPADRAEAVEAAADRLASFLERYRESGRTPIFVRAHHDAISNSPVWDAKYGEGGIPCAPGSTEAEFLPALGVREDDPVVTKYRYDSFYGTGLAPLLSANDVSELLVAGVATHVCVESAVRSAFDRDLAVTVLADCTTSADPDDAAAALERIDGTFGSVAEADDVELGAEPMA